ncbi:hypothetical protein FNF27_08124 [Cafeteria roenbergensis]|uniref:Glutaredoxin domain-containing protein n=1 Tax=Cafeteria roenbergensis TaxID=33653 RepID=A0A5A8C1Y0_CAFRO|nr:hypothetical protein FNF29_07670 [Cafeteria roenbergensis]KAA0161875.1 hypothetical protein FNF27_08124 [Cafeteria roenbergensis]|eukprot:KAA0147043.1 hypothetical protein FNF29_07670 [Cafeteria roenbergensis]
MPRLLTVSAASRAEDDSHDDFKPVSKVDTSNVSETISKIVTENPIVLFMKGTPQQPMCGFSNRVVMIMNMHGLPYHAVNVLADPAIREGIKAFSDWPTIPQLYVKGEFVGGCDIVSDMHEDGSLADTLKAAE